MIQMHGSKELRQSSNEEVEQFHFLNYDKVLNEKRFY